MSDKRPPAWTQRKDVPLELSSGHRLTAVLVAQELGVSIGDLDRYPLKETLAKRKKIVLLSQREIIKPPSSEVYYSGDHTHLIKVRIFADQGTWTAFVTTFIIRPHRGDVDEQSTRLVDPASVDPIENVRRGPDGIMRVDLQQVGTATGYPWEVEVMLGHVVVISKEVNARFRELHINVGIPWENLTDHQSR
jgi:hypothetical protein